MRLSEITVEELRADHEAFAKRMAQFPKQPMEHRGVPMVETRYRPDWRQKLRARSPFDD